VIKHLTTTIKPYLLNSRALNALFCCTALSLSSAVQAAPDAPDGSSFSQEDKTLPSVIEVPDSELPSPPILEEEFAAEDENTFKVMINEITFDGVTVFEISELDEQVSDDLGYKHSFVSLKRIAAQIAGLYQEAGYLMAQVYIPEQKLIGGKLQININEGLIGNIHIDQQGLLKPHITEKYLLSLKGTVIKSDILERKTRLLSDLPANEVSIVFEPSLKEGHTDMMVVTTDVKDNLGYISLDNHGNRYIGSERISGQYNFNNKLGLGEKFTINGVSSGKGYSNIALKSQLPIGGNGLLLNNELSFNHYRLGDIFSPLKAHGKSHSFSAGLFYPFIRSLNKNIYFNSQIKRKEFKDKTDSVGSSTTKTLDSLNINLSGNYIELFGDPTLWGVGFNTGYVSLDDSQQSSDSYGTHGSYSFIDANLEHLYRFNDKWAVHLSAAVQLAGSNLDSAVKMQLGGSSAVRAYPQGEASVDSGAIANISFNYQKSDDLEIGLFFDAAAGKEHKSKLVTDTNNSKKLSGVGLKLNWDLADDWYLSSSIAWRTDSKPESDTRDSKPRFWIQLVRYL
jgi:hemolysin activation/secretion protein